MGVTLATQLTLEGHSSNKYMGVTVTTQLTLEDHSSNK